MSKSSGMRRVVTILYVEGDNGGPLFVKIITEAVEKRDIDVHIEARALRLIVDSYGPKQRIVGLVVREDMEERCYRANKGVVFVCGWLRYEPRNDAAIRARAGKGRVLCQLVTQTIPAAVSKWDSVLALERLICTRAF